MAAPVGRHRVPGSTASTRQRPRPVIARALENDDEAWLDPDATRSLLEAYGLPLVAERIAATPDEAVAAAAELGFPVVVKTAAAGAHKTETGGVALDLADDRGVRAAASESAAPVIVQPMIRAASSCSRAWPRIPSSGRSSPSAPGASSPS